MTVAELLGGHVEAAIDWLHAVDPVETDPELPSQQPSWQLVLTAYVPPSRSVFSAGS